MAGGIKSTDIIGKTFNYLTVLKETTQRRGTSILWECECICGNHTLATSSDLKSGHKKSCGCLHKKQVQSLGYSKGANLLNQKFGELTVIEKTDERKDQRILWKCKCSCGKEFLASTKQLHRGMKCCDVCLSKNRSNGEYKIKVLLEKNNIPYESEKIFQDLRGDSNKPLRFDFYINNSYLIEFDGKQHYINDGGFGSDLEQIQLRDQIKNEYCFKNNIPLIRIPYTQLEELTIEDLRIDTSNFVIKEV